jgi:tRNA-splicing ligase RtcB
VPIRERQYHVRAPAVFWTDRVVTFIGTDVDESLMAHQRLPKVIAHHAGTMKVLQTLRPFAVTMAGAVEFNPFKD